MHFAYTTHCQRILERNTNQSFMQNEKIKLCVFDLAGTIVQDNNAVQKVFIKAFKDHDLKVDPHQVNAMMGYEKKYAITKLFESTGSPWSAKKMIPAIHKSFNEGMIKYYLDHAKPMVYANTALKKIKAQDIKIAVNTGFGKRILLTIIDSLQWQDLIDASISSDQVSEGRPQPFMIEALKKKTKVMSSKQVAKVGDTPSDLMEGHHADCALNIGIYSKNFPLEEMKKYPHTHLVPTLKEATMIILAHNATA